MNDQDRGTLKSNRSYIIKHLENIDDVVDGLMERNVITDGMKEDIEVEKGKQQKIRKMLDILPRRGPDAFGHFLQILVDKHNGFIANTLHPGYAAVVGESNTTGYGCGDEPDQEQLPDTWPNEDAVREEMKVKVCPKNPEILKNWNGQQVYKMKKKIRGKVLVINNETFTGPLEKDKDGKNRITLNVRTGTEKDARAVRTLFEQLNFHVTVLKDQKAQEMVDAFKQETQDPIHVNAECFILVILTHGTKDGVYGHDGNVLNIEDIKSHFDGQNFPCMADKPKLFFIQACRGESYDYGASFDTEKAIEEQRIKLGKTTLADMNMPDAKLEKSRTPIKSHFLVAMASTLDSVSFRNIILGSWFIQAVVYVFRKFSWKEDLLTMLSKVNLLVSKGRAVDPETRQEALAVSEFQGTLLHQFYFFPGLYDEESSPIMHPTDEKSSIITHPTS